MSKLTPANIAQVFSTAYRELEARGQRDPAPVAFEPGVLYWQDQYGAFWFFDGETVRLHSTAADRALERR